MARRSSGLLLYAHRPEGLLVFLVHPGGPFWARKDFRSWSIPKGEVEKGEDDRGAAFREFRAETGLEVPEGSLVDLGSAMQPSRKLVTAFALEGDVDASAIRSVAFEIE